MTRYSQHVNDLETPQREKARSDQTPNNAGGFVFQLDKWARLDRFLILGTEGGTYYVDEKKHTKQAAEAVRQCLAEDGSKTVKRIAEISESGRAHKNDPAIFALAMAAGASDAKTRQAALTALPRVCRIGTHLFHFCADVTGFRRWGRGLRNAVANWYTERQPSDLAYQLVKYQSRDKWSHKNVLQLAHPSPPTTVHGALFRYVVRGLEKFPDQHPKRDSVKSADTTIIKDLPAIIAAFEEIHSGVDVKRAAALIVEHRLPHECVPNELKDKVEIWEALLPDMGLTACIRNLGKMSSVGLLKPMSAASKRVTEKLLDRAALKKARVHPMSVLLALRTYQSGHGFRGSLTWSPDRAVVDALDEAFYLAFDAIEPTGKNILLALDVSGSMGATINGTNLTCREASAAMAMVTARTEKNWHCVGFTAPGGRGGRNWGNHFFGGPYGGMHGGGAPSLTELNISPKQRLDDVVRSISNLPFGGTDCAQPMLYAAGKELDVDCFQLYTDNETWAGGVHPFQALQAYRNKQNKPHAKLVVVGMTASEFSIADPSDAGMMDFVGFDANAPAAIASFVREGG